jgi:protein-tyrosine-phosphatase
MARDVYNGVLPYAKDPEIRSKLECWEVPDPWYGGEDGFEDVFHIIDKKVKLLLEKL